MTVCSKPVASNQKGSDHEKCTLNGKEFPTRFVLFRENK